MQSNEIHIASLAGLDEAAGAFLEAVGDAGAAALRLLRERGRVEHLVPRGRGDGDRVAGTNLVHSFSNEGVKTDRRPGMLFP